MLINQHSSLLAFPTQRQPRLPILLYILFRNVYVCVCAYLYKLQCFISNILYLASFLNEY